MVEKEREIITRGKQNAPSEAITVDQVIDMTDDKMNQKITAKDGTNVNIDSVLKPVEKSVRSRDRSIKKKTVNKDAKSTTNGRGMRPGMPMTKRELHTFIEKNYYVGGISGPIKGGMGLSW